METFHDFTSVLSLAVIEWYKGDGGHLEISEEHEFPEDSDYESEHELASNPTSENVEADCEKRGRELLPVLKIGSPVS